MEKEIIIWTFIFVFVFTAVITVLGIIKNIKFVEIEDKYLSILSKALLLEIAVVIMGFGASSFNELSQETSCKKEIENLNKLISSKSEEAAELNKLLFASNREIEIKSEEIAKLNKKILETAVLEEKRKIAEKKSEEYTFEDAKNDFEKSIYFKVNGAHIDKRSKALLSDAVRKLAGYSNIAIHLQPHNSRTKDESAYRPRQIAVREYLMAQGFPSHRILFITNSWLGGSYNDVYDEDNDMIEVGLSIELKISDV